MDIQRSFDSTMFAAVQEALESCDVDKTVIRWIVNTLKCRNIHPTYQDESAEARVVEHSLDIPGRKCGSKGCEGLPTRRSIVTSAVVYGC